MKRIERIITGKVSAVSPEEKIIQIQHRDKKGRRVTTTIKPYWLDMTPEQMKRLRQYKEVTAVTSIIASGTRGTDEE